MINQQKWEIVLSCDGRYDGVFFYAVRSTGIFCRPSCKSKAPLRQNILFFDTREQAAQAGFRPCKRCRPDLAEYMPVPALLQQAKDLLDACYTDTAQALSHRLSTIGLSRRHLSSLFKQQYGMPIHAYIQAMRVRHAEMLLRGTRISIHDIAVDCGFESLPAFYRAFTRHTGVPPAKCRKLHQQKELHTL